MSLILGIDTGGTYTDAVVIDNQSREVLAKAKSLTTHEDLSLGIADCIRSMDGIDHTCIEYVSLSTTLATNAIVEGKGCEVGLIMLGFEPDTELPVKMMRQLPGGHSIHGQETQPFDEDAVRQALESMRGKVDALAISSFLSVRNPEHELRASRLCDEILGLPVVCGHQLTRSLGMPERTVTAVLNARLIPVIHNLIQSVKLVLEKKGVEAPIMVVRGDGSLMGESYARQKPIETILSGPAASIIGASFLTKEADAMVLDMGGTTTDIAILKNGVPRLNHEGARVGGWLTRVEAAEIDTCGLGGDSYVQIGAGKKLKVGPQRVWPFCLMASRHPHLVGEIEAIPNPATCMLMYAEVCDCFILLQQRASVQLSEQEQSVVECLADGPHSLFTLAQSLDVLASHLDLSHLVDSGIVGRISVTPTDILHVLGRYTRWNRGAARTAVAVMASRLMVDAETFCHMVEEKVVERLCQAAWQSLLNREGAGVDLEEDTLFSFLSRNQRGELPGSMLDVCLSPKVPVIGIGAPVEQWLPPMAEKLRARLVLPPHTEVANAVGAAASRVIEVVRALITPGENGSGYELYSEFEHMTFADFDEALEHALEFVETQACEKAEQDGAKRITVAVNHEDVYATASGVENEIFIESRIEAIASEQPEWE